MIETIRQGLHAEGITVSMAKLCRWLDVPRRTAYYRPVQSAPKVNPKYADPIEALIEKSPSFGYQTVAHLLGFNKHTVQRVFQRMGWQVRKRAVGFRPRIQALPSVATVPNERWSTDLCRIWAGRDGWATLALVIDGHTRELLGWRLSRSGKASTAGSALEHALIARFGVLGRVPAPFLLRSDNGLVLPRASTRRWHEAMDCVRSSSPRTAHNRTGWSNVSFARSKSSVSIDTALKACGMPAARLATGPTVTTTGVRIRRWT